VTTSSGRQAESYRQAHLRLRLLLLGDGIDTPGRVRGEADRQQVSAELRRMRSAFDAVVEEAEAHRTDAVDERVEGLDEALRGAASSPRTPQIRPDAEIPALVTPADPAVALRVSIGSVYRAIMNEEIRATRLVEKRGALRIPRRELERLLEERAATRTPSGSRAGHSSMR